MAAIDYLVRWEVEVEATSPREAVDKAVAMLPTSGEGFIDTLATCFQVLPVCELSSVTPKQNSPEMERPLIFDVLD